MSEAVVFQIGAVIFVGSVALVEGWAGRSG